MSKSKRILVVILKFVYSATLLDILLEAHELPRALACGQAVNSSFGL